MTQREIIKALLAKEIPERVGLNEHFWPHIIDNAWGEQGIPDDVDYVERFNLDIRSVAGFGCPGPGRTWSAWWRSQTSGSSTAARGAPR
jgi:hypothetical protein